ncbi:hypothetical protein WJX74_010486 [Apatococcus lobatus]|uniref:Uncharacterized protein n=1 Tax=Apatococcus lobatus TaxID=904363 RepID=A0AAW1RR70_9CHLO
MASFEKSGYTKDRTTSRHTQRQWLTPVVTAVFAPQKTSLPPRARTCGTHCCVCFKAGWNHCSASPGGRLTSSGSADSRRFLG